MKNQIIPQRTISTINNPTVAVVIATHNRPELLKNRSLPSVYRQTHSPDFIVIVDDSLPTAMILNKQIIDALPLNDVIPVYLENYRTKGASGAWNTGLKWLMSNIPDSNNTFVAILDDDDEWDGDHLESCLRSNPDLEHDITISGIVRHEDNKPPKKQSIPSTLEVNELLVRNPHIQGSNLFVRLHTLLQAGLFDEAMKSSTDRDMCIRLADLGSLQIGKTDKHTVLHFASEEDKSRLSQPESVQRIEGLNYFYQKYHGRMSSSQEPEFIARAQKLFHHDPRIDREPKSTTSEVKTEQATKPEPGAPLALIVGVIGDPLHPGRIERQTDDFQHLMEEGQFASIDYLILENGNRLPRTESPFLKLESDINRSTGIRCHLFTIEEQIRDAQSSVFGQKFTRAFERVGLGQARAMLQMYAYGFMRGRSGAITWVLDDDKRLGALISTENGVFRDTRIPYHDLMWKLKNEDPAIVVGIDTDSPPLPFLSTIRTQLGDLYHNLCWLGNLSPNSILPNRHQENMAARKRWTDYYYDLSRVETSQLEYPFWMIPNESGETVQKTFGRLSSALGKILHGEEVFRPLCVSWDTLGSVIDGTAWQRGGNTLFFDPEALLDSAEILVQEPWCSMRRTDMVRTLASMKLNNKLVLKANIPVLHDRSDRSETQLDLSALTIDVQGYALYSALNDMIELHQATASKKDASYQDQFFDDMVDRGCDLYLKYREERCAAYVLSSYRVQGLITSIRHTLNQGHWWQSDSSFANSLSELHHSLGEIDMGQQNLDLTKLVELSDGLKRTELQEYFRYFLSQPSSVGLRPVLQLDCLEQRVAEKRMEIAEELISTLANAKNLKPLGAGAEGVVFTDGTLVYKYFDYWKTVDVGLGKPYVKDLVGRWKDTTCLYPLLHFWEHGSHGVLAYPFELSTPYIGGYGKSLIQLLQECRKVGIVCRNIHPKNLIVVGDKVRLIDYGSDIRPYSEEEFEKMCQRAWLTWRWHHLKNLKVLMKTVLHDPEIPEMTGYHDFRIAIDPPDPDSTKDSLLEKLVMEVSPESVLDYGCGKGKLAHRIARHGVDVKAWDPNLTLRKRWGDYQEESIEFGDKSLLQKLLKSETLFDVVVCGQVLCTLPEGDQYNDALRNIRKLVSDDGRVFISICNPYFSDGGDTAYMDKFLPSNANCETTFKYSATHGITGNELIEYHRSPSQFENDMRIAGLQPVKVRQPMTVDSERFEPSADSLILEAVPVPHLEVSVTLMIKACLMEYATIEHQVKHLVKQLESPRTFSERILVVDSKKDGFIRQYTNTDQKAFESAVDKLLNHGIIDHVHWTPNSSKDIRSLNQRWFAADTIATHSKNGAPLVAPLNGIDHCSSEYILQVDSDVLIGREDPCHDYLKDMIDVFKGDPSAVTVAFNIANHESKPYTNDKDGLPWRVEVRAAMLHRERLLSQLPLPNPCSNEILEYSWHRALDVAVKVGQIRSYRGGDSRTFFVHPENSIKTSSDEWMLIMDRIEQGIIPAIQYGNVNLQEGIGTWMKPARAERFVFLIFGKDVLPGRFQRCFDSLLSQNETDWGAIIIDDGSDPRIQEYIYKATSGHHNKISLLLNRTPRGKMENTTLAIRNICTNPESAILTLDMDDVLLGRSALCTIREAFHRGADATVGSMLRTDKDVTYPVSFTDPRTNRQNNLWQHVRSFKKRLFDAVPDDYLRVNGEYPRLADDWAIMLPIAELASCPNHIQKPLYLHEPSGAGKREDRVERESIIHAIVAKPSLRSLV